MIKAHTARLASVNVGTVVRGGAHMVQWSVNIGAVVRVSFTMDVPMRVMASYRTMRVVASYRPMRVMASYGPMRVVASCSPM